MTPQPFYKPLPKEHENVPYYQCSETDVELSQTAQVSRYESRTRLINNLDAAINQLMRSKKALTMGIEHKKQVEEKQSSNRGSRFSTIEESISVTTSFCGTANNRNDDCKRRIIPEAEEETNQVKTRYHRDQKQRKKARGNRDTDPKCHCTPRFLDEYPDDELLCWKNEEYMARRNEAKTSREYDHEAAMAAWNQFYGTPDSPRREQESNRRDRTRCVNVRDDDKKNYRENRISLRPELAELFLGKQFGGKHSVQKHIVEEFSILEDQRRGGAVKQYKVVESADFEQPNRSKFELDRKPSDDFTKGSNDDDLCQLFYGSTEVDACMNRTVRSLLQAQKQMKNATFASGNLMPSGKVFLEQIETMLKHYRTFNTQYRNLTKRTVKLLNDGKGDKIQENGFEVPPNTVRQRFPGI